MAITKESEKYAMHRKGIKNIYIADDAIAEHHKYVLKYPSNRSIN
ncbi:hypothetical protein SAMN05421863_10304 [Nitrosomonas communis]|uniref:Uncharacterized protein n=1 Tax=Nitrosomonas communis TaxID=44574 RepID=A0A1I4R3T0_9PROT|nr:hypothetical protein SAMN05421863_10304 [Nitrosomonas communis]